MPGKAKVRSWPDDDDPGFSEFMERVDAVVMGRSTFETVLGFGSGWPYPIPGIVLSSTISSAPDEIAQHVQFASGSPSEIVKLTKEQGFNDLYIDGGKTIQGFLKEDQIDELIITEIPLLPGGGDRLFGPLEQQLPFELIDIEVLLGQLAKKHYRRKRN